MSALIKVCGCACVCPNAEDTACRVIVLLHRTLRQFHKHGKAKNSHGRRTVTFRKYLVSLETLLWCTTETELNLNCLLFSCDASHFKSLLNNKETTYQATVHGTEVSRYRDLWTEMYTHRFDDVSHMYRRCTSLWSAVFVSTTAKMYSIWPWIWLDVTCRLDNATDGCHMKSNGTELYTQCKFTNVDSTYSLLMHLITDAMYKNCSGRK